VNRRSFITGAVALVGASKISFAGDVSEEYTPGLIEEKLAAGETVFVDYFATWCSTCARQERIVKELRAAHPEFDENISFVKVDWDTYSSHEVTTSRNIPRRSTLVLLRGEEELGRIVAGTGSDEIKALLDLGVASA